MSRAMKSIFLEGKCSVCQKDHAEMDAKLLEAKEMILESKTLLLAKDYTGSIHSLRTRGRMRRPKGPRQSPTRCIRIWSPTHDI